MPEGDTIHKLAGYLREHLVGRTLANATALGRPLALQGQAVTAADAQGKHLLLRFAGGAVLRTHLGMYGSWHRYRADGPAPRVRGRVSIALTVAGPPLAEVFACYNAKEVELLPAGSVRERALAAHLGDDLLGTDPDLARIATLARQLLAPDTLLVDVLLDQRVAAGIGNVYKSELLFLAGLAPATRLGQASDDTLRSIYADARRWLSANLGGGPRTTRTTADGAGRLWVYNRGGRPCHRCRTPIVSARLGARPRGTWWCPTCQAGHGGVTPDR
jgi:endonuclease-8